MKTLVLSTSHNQTPLSSMTRHEYKLPEITSILDLKRSGMSNSAISRQQGIPRTTVRRLIKKHLKDNGASLGTPTRRGISNGLTRREKSAVIRNVQKNPWQTLVELSQYGTGVHPLNPRTVRRVLDTAGIRQCASIDVPSSTQKQHQAQQDGAKDHTN